MGAMETSILLATLVAELLLGGSLVLTLRLPRIRIWPPPRRRSWQYVYTWGLTLVSFAGILALGVLDWNSFVLEHCLRVPIGLGLIVSSIVLAIWAIRTLGLHASQGLGGRLVESGPYSFTRNPQYLADIGMLAGFAVLANSVYLWITCLLGMVWFVLAPFTEEPWLRDRFGEEYDFYMKRVPRFLSFGGQDDAGGQERSGSRGGTNGRRE
jgi:protein-S-isoprenylcysteine O-methyltransferase Ste14